MPDITSGVWGGVPEPITQPFGVYNPELARWYGYAADYGWAAGTHIGLDVGVPKFTPIYAAQSGKVSEAGFSDSFRPNPVRIIEDDGDEAIYGHLWSNVVSAGQKIKKGQLIGYSGEQTIKGTMTPDGSGPHLHFELRRPDPVTGGYKAVDPGPELTGSTDYQDVGSHYGKNPYEVDQLAWGIDAGAVESGGRRVLLGAGGILLLLVGAWVLLGAPTSYLDVAKGVTGG